MEAKPNKLRIMFVPQVMGVFVLLIIILAFVIGILRQELALVLTGAAFLLPWVYCLVMTLLLSLIHYRRTRRAFIRISPRDLVTGDMAEAVYSEADAIGDGAAPIGRIPELPGIVVRCRLLLATKDGRRIQHDFNPADSSPHCFVAEKRGAYFSTHDEFAVFDILGFFRFAHRLSADADARLLVSPNPAEEPPAIRARAGESNLTPEFSFQRTDNFIDHRPYVPGDDPRRINWKLYGHGGGLATVGGLFVREGEREPPPQSNIIILIDTEFDPRLYKVSAARRGIDTLCENALAASLACTESGMNVLIGYSGDGAIHAGNARHPKDAQSLAWPAALPLGGSLGLPTAPVDRGILILALPRSVTAASEKSALNRFLDDAAERSVEVLFFCDSFADNRRTTVRNSTIVAAEFLAITEFCAASYNRRPGVRARVLV